MQAAEEKERKKVQKQRAMAKARAIARGEPIDDSDGEDQEAGAEDGTDEDEGTGKGKKDLNVGAENIASLSAKVVGTNLKARPRPVVDAEEDEEEEEEVPVLINRDLPNLKTVLEKADVLLEVLDGRDPLAFRSKHIEELGSELGKKVLLVVNKIGQFMPEIHVLEFLDLTCNIYRYVSSRGCCFMVDLPEEPASYIPLPFRHLLPSRKICGTKPASGKEGQTQSQSTHGRCCWPQFRPGLPCSIGEREEWRRALGCGCCRCHKCKHWYPLYSSPEEC
jgi:hypothetical protein